MFKTEVYFQNLNTVKTFVDMVSMYPKHEIYLVSDIYTMDAHSLIGILSLDISHPIELQVLSDDIPQSFFEDLKPFIYQKTTALQPER
ncbi:MAG: HPr family phosphocarrier protein [Clostridia bacterium]|nr:HPr family phosphocarrier protein [Clostridia bacterium]